MRISRIIVVALSFFIAGCSEKRPVHPYVGLRVYSNGYETSKCGFFVPESIDGLPGVQPKLTPKSIRHAGDGHEVSVQWEPDLGGAEDHYHLVITADQVMSKRRVTYRGQPIVLVEQPFRVVMENVYQQVTDEELKRVFGHVHEGMTYSEIAHLLPSIGACRPFEGEHGGAWYTVSSEGGFTLGFRFEHSTEGSRPELGTKKRADCKVNMRPGLYDPHRIEVLEHHGSNSRE